MGFSLTLPLANVAQRNCRSNASAALPRQLLCGVLIRLGIRGNYVSSAHTPNATSFKRSGVLLMVRQRQASHLASVPKHRGRPNGDWLRLEFVGGRSVGTGLRRTSRPLLFPQTSLVGRSADFSRRKDA